MAVQLFKTFSLGVRVVLAMAVLSSLLLLFFSHPDRAGLDFWTFSKTHVVMYVPETERWNQRADAREPVRISLLSGESLNRRILSSFQSDTPGPDAVEVYSSIAAQCFKGPLQDVGFVDLTEKIRAEGLASKFNKTSLSPWISRGRNFGLPHDVHPVVLGYRADIIEAAGIDMSAIETWGDFVRVLSPLVRDVDGDGYIDHYLLNLWETQPGLIELLMLQAGGSLFDKQDNLAMDSDVNAKVLATIVSWTTGWRPIATNAPEEDATSNKMRQEGYILCNLVPDWLAGMWEIYTPNMAGKYKLMPLPAWERGGRRVSVLGGTMVGIPRGARDFDTAWNFVKHLYLSREVARQLYRKTRIISPVVEFWSDPVYDEPVSFFGDQPIGKIFIKYAPEVPERSSSAYNSLALNALTHAALKLKALVANEPDMASGRMRSEAKSLLTEAQRTVARQMARNVFLKPTVRGAT